MEAKMQIILPSGMTRENTCCFTGHRTIPTERQDEFAAELKKIIRILAESGYRYFICGGALGFDTLAAQKVALFSERYEDIHLILALPCLNQTDKWINLPNGEAHIREYQRPKGLADHVVYIREFYTPDCMKERNRFMVDNSSFCIAYYNGSTRSGSGQTYRMAKNARIPIYNLHDGSSFDPDDTEA